MGYTVKITIGDKDIHPVNSFTIEQTFDDHHRFQCSFYGDVNVDKSDKKHLEKFEDWLGQKIIISVDEEKLKFIGLICELQFSSEGLNGTIVLSGYSPTIALDTVYGHYEAYSEISLHELIETIKGRIDKDRLSWQNETEENFIFFEYISQYNESYFPFLKRVCSTYGLPFYYDGQNLVCGTYSAKSIAIEMEHLREFQYKSRVFPLAFEQFNYDYLIEGGPESRYESINQNNILISDPLGKYAYERSESLFRARSTAPSQHNEQLEQMYEIRKKAASSKLVQIGGRSMEPSISIGSHLEILDTKSGQGLGSYLIDNIKHEYTIAGEYTNSFSGILAEFLSPPTKDSGPIAQPQLAVVVSTTEEDRFRLGRIKVKMLWQDAPHTSDWLQVESFGANERNRGLSFIPQEGDEVMIGFKNGNPDQPYVMGSFASIKSFTNGINPGEGLVAGEGGKALYFRDENDKQSIGLIDANNNELQLDTAANGLNILSREHLQLKSQVINIDTTSLKLKATDKLSVRAFDATTDVGKDYTMKAEGEYALIATNITQKTAKADGRWKPDEDDGYDDFNVDADDFGNSTEDWGWSSQP